MSPTMMEFTHRFTAIDRGLTYAMNTATGVVVFRENAMTFVPGENVAWRRVLDADGAWTVEKGLRPIGDLQDVAGIDEYVSGLQSRSGHADKLWVNRILQAWVSYDGPLPALCVDVDQVAGGGEP